jgi:hypothetical protein
MDTDAPAPATAAAAAPDANGGPPPAPELSPEMKDKLSKLRDILCGKTPIALNLEFLYMHNKADLQVRVPRESGSGVAGSGVVVSVCFCIVPYDGSAGRVQLQGCAVAHVSGMLAVRTVVLTLSVSLLSHVSAPANASSPWCTHTRRS